MRCDSSCKCGFRRVPHVEAATAVLAIAPDAALACEGRRHAELQLDSPRHQEVAVPSVGDHLFGKTHVKSLGGVRVRCVAPCRSCAVGVWICTIRAAGPRACNRRAGAAHFDATSGDTHVQHLSTPNLTRQIGLVQRQPRRQ